MNEQFITLDWLVERKACAGGLVAFRKYFPSGGEALEVLKRCEELGYRRYAMWLSDHLFFAYCSSLGNAFYCPKAFHIKDDNPLLKNLLNKKLTFKNGYDKKVLSAFLKL